MARDGLTIDKLPAALEGHAGALPSAGPPIIDRPAIAGRVGLEIDMDALDRMGKESRCFVQASASTLEDFTRRGGRAAAAQAVAPRALTRRTLGEKSGAGPAAGSLDGQAHLPQAALPCCAATWRMRHHPSRPIRS
jgi:dihydroxy-acid dehydratase